MTCDECRHYPGTKAAVIQGVYYAHLCGICEVRLNKRQTPSSGAADWARGRDYEDHLHDIVQPYTDGHANPDFIKAYPDKARQMFSEEELRKYG